MNLEFIKQQLATLNLPSVDQSNLLGLYISYQEAIDQDLSERTQKMRFNKLRNECICLNLKVLDVITLLQEPEKITIDQPWMNMKPEGAKIETFTTSTKKGLLITGSLNDDQKNFLELIYLCSKPEAFLVEGMMFKGNYIEACKQYVKNNPSKKFFIWLQDNYPILEEVKK